MSDPGFGRLPAYLFKRMEAKKAMKNSPEKQAGKCIHPGTRRL